MKKPTAKHLLPGFILIAMAAAVCLPLSRLMAGTELLVVDPMEAVYPDVRPPSLGVTLAAPRGGTMLVQVVLLGEPGNMPVDRLDLLENGEPVSGAQWYALPYVPVEQNTGMNFGTEALDGRKNPYVIRRAPFEITDPMVPVGENWDSAGWKARSADFDQQARSSFAVRWPIGADAKAGVHDYVVTAKLKGGEKVSARFSVQVYPVVMPSTARRSFDLVQTLHCSPIAKSHHVPLWSEEFWKLFEHYARTLVEGGQSTGFVMFEQMAEDCPTGTEPQFGERADRMIKIYKEVGMRDYLGSQLFYPILPEDPKNPRWGVNSYTSPVFGTPEGDAKVRALYAQVRKVIEANGLTGKFKMQIKDEAPESYNALYVRAAKMLREEIPGVKIYEVINSPNLGIADSVDEWCPMANVYLFRRDFFEQRKAAGSKVAFYTCMGPGASWVNRLLDEERTRVAHIPWFVYGYGLSGYLHWGANCWMSEPFKQSVVSSGTSDPKLFLPAGDTHILYPGDAGPWISLRYEAQRLGAEDYEALNIYGKQDAEAAGKLVFKHFPAMDQGPRDGASYWQARHDLLAAASGFPASGRVETSGNRKVESAGPSPKQEAQSSGFLKSFLNLFSK
jgi:hypothetical protein